MNLLNSVGNQSSVMLFVALSFGFFYELKIHTFKFAGFT